MAKKMVSKMGKGITAKQRAARKRNMAIARAARAKQKKGMGLQKKSKAALRRSSRAFLKKARASGEWG